MEKEKVTTPEVQVAELAIVSGTPFEFGVQELIKLSERAEGITSTDHADYKEVKAEMVKRRNYIKQYCLDARRGIKKAAEGVSGVENILYDLFVPEENRLIEISKTEKLEKQRKERVELLPRRKADLAAIGDDREALDENLLEMDAAAFNTYLNGRVADKNEADRIENDRVKKEQEDKAKELEWEKGAQERERTARADEAKKNEIYTSRIEILIALGLTDQGDNYVYDEQVSFSKVGLKESCTDEFFNEFVAGVERRKQQIADGEARKEREEKAAEAKKAKELEDDVKYQAWLRGHGYTPETSKQFYMQTDVNQKVYLYQIVGTYQK